MAKRARKKQAGTLLLVVICIGIAVALGVYLMPDTVKIPFYNQPSQQSITQEGSVILPPAAHAKLPRGKKYTCKPTITVDTSAAPDLKNWMGTTVVPILQDWYPVIGDKIAWPVYAPRCTFTITVKPLPAGTEAVVSYSAGNVIVDAQYARTHTDDVGFFIHTVTHAIQSYESQDVPGWVREGIADWARYYIYQDKHLLPPAQHSSYKDGYTSAAYFLNYIKTTYDKGFIFKLNMYAHEGTYTDAIFKNSTGKTVDQLWAEMPKQK